MMNSGFLEAVTAGAANLAVLGGAAGGGFGVVKWFLEFATKRADAKAAMLDADTRFVIDNLRQEFTRVTDRLGKAEDHILELRRSLNECEAKHSIAESQVQRLSAMLEAHTRIQDDGK